MREHIKGKQLSEMAEARAREKGIPFSVALVEIAQENPVLASEAREESLGRTMRIETIGGQPGTNTGTFRMTVIHAAERLASLAKVRAEVKSIGYGVALSEVSRENPGLAHAARVQVLGTEV